MGLNANGWGVWRTGSMKSSKYYIGKPCVFRLQVTCAQMRRLSDAATDALGNVKHTGEWSVCRHSRDEFELRRVRSNGVRKDFFRIGRDDLSSLVSEIDAVLCAHELKALRVSAREGVSCGEQNRRG